MNFSYPQISENIFAMINSIFPYKISLFHFSLRKLFIQRKKKKKNIYIYIYIYQSIRIFHSNLYVDISVYFAVLATLKSCDTTKQSVDDYIYIYIDIINIYIYLNIIISYIYIYIYMYVYIYLKTFLSMFFVSTCLFISGCLSLTQLFYCNICTLYLSIYVILFNYSAIYLSIRMCSFSYSHQFVYIRMLLKITSYEYLLIQGFFKIFLCLYV